MDWHLLWQIFWLFTKVAMFSWGGGPGSMGLMQRETVAAGWMQPDEFADGMALGNALPGPIAPQVSAFVGYKLAGTAGAIVAVAGTVLPTTILMLVVVIYFFSFKDTAGGQVHAPGGAPVRGRPAGVDNIRYGADRLRSEQARLGAGAAAELGQGVDRRRHFHGPQPDDGQPHLAGGGHRDSRADSLPK